MDQKIQSEEKLLQELQKLRKRTRFTAIILNLVALSFLVFMVVVMAKMAPDASFWLKFSYHFVTISVLGLFPLKMMLAKDATPEQRVAGITFVAFCVFQIVVFNSLT